MLRGESELLDNPAWFSLTRNLAHLGEGGRLARRFLPDVSPFAGVKAATQESFDALGDLLDDGESAVLIMQGTAPSIESLSTTYLFDVLQMVDSIDVDREIDSEAVRLSGADADDMMALVERTKPGPFGPRTGEMGNYLGIHRNGRLVAMAGERMQFGRFVEISAVCVDEEFRGRGMAKRLMNRLRRDIYERGRIPFLHVRSDATRTARLYEIMGFVSRATFNLHLATAKRKSR